MQILINISMNSNNNQRGLTKIHKQWRESHKKTIKDQGMMDVYYALLLTKQNT